MQTGSSFPTGNAQLHVYKLNKPIKGILHDIKENRNDVMEVHSGKAALDQTMPKSRARYETVNIGRPEDLGFIRSSAE